MGGAGDLRNFGFALASPDFDLILRRSDRGPNFVYKDASAMADELNRIAEKYPEDLSAGETPPPVPRMKNVRLAVNVASCDGLPSLLVVGSDGASLKRMERSLGELIWDEQLAGLYIYGLTTSADDLSFIEGTGGSGFLVVQPDPYGLGGKVLKALPETLSGEELRGALLDLAGDFDRVPKTHGTHVRNGRRSGIAWETEVEVPDRQRNSRRGPGRP